MERKEHALFCLEQGFELQFRLGPTLQGKEVQVYTNYPTNGHKFEQLTFHSLDWVYPNSHEDDSDKYCRLDLAVAGSYQYYFSCGDTKRVNGGYIVVDPVLRVGANDDILPLDCISSLTYQANHLGPLDQWLNQILVAKETGYNMIHFTPLQELGHSGSSIANQLALNPAFSPVGKRYTWEDIGNLVEVLRKDWKMVCITDVVYNHTAADSKWIQLHPECGYNLVNSPDLKPAWLLDRALWHLSCEVKDGKYSKQGVPALIKEERHLTALRGLLWQQVFPRLRLWEFTQVNLQEAVEQFRQLLQTGPSNVSHVANQGYKTELKVVQDPKYRRFGNSVDLSGATHTLTSHNMKPQDIEELCNCLKMKLEQLNWEFYKKINDYAEQATDHIVDNVRFERLANDGPKLGPVTTEHPLFPRYFTFPFEEMGFPEEMQLMDQTEKACHILAYDGLVQRDVRRQSAVFDPDSYLRRELVCPGNNVKLRYGNKPEDCPYLWAHMKAYTETTAKVFSGVCLVNSHSTPLHVSEMMLAAARAIRPNLYVTAELQTGSQPADNGFMNHLGITSLQRGVADNGKEEAWLSCFGSEPVGAFVQPSLRPLMPAAAHTMFKDITLKHGSPVQKCSLYNILPNSTLVALACCATGSVRGYDELLLHQVPEMSENHQYASWDAGARTANQVNLQTGILAAKLALNRLHQQLAAEGFTQGDVKQLDGGVTAVTRHCPSSHRSVVAVVRRAHQHPAMHHCSNGPAIFIPGQIEEVLLEAVTTVKNSNRTNGSPQWTSEIREHIQVKDTMVKIKVQQNSAVQEVVFEELPLGYVVVFRVELDSKSRQQIESLRHHLIQFSPQYQTGSAAGQNTPAALIKPLMTTVSRLTLADMNMLLYCCDAEEKERGGGCYNIPSWSPLTYGGLQGLMSVMAEIRPRNELSHPLCENLRRGDWMMDYITNRLLARGGAVGEMGQWFQAMFGYMKHIPHYLVPCYFDAIIQGVYTTALSAIFHKMSRFVLTGSSLVKQLSLGSVQMCAEDHSLARLTLSPHLKHFTHGPNGGPDVHLQSCISLSAGLPHFCTGMFRCWGRDTFISFRGLLLLTGRHLEARNTILSFASMLRYGLIPNLLNQGGHARYNSRDAVWWWLQCVQDYCSLVPDGSAILECPVSRMYPTDESEPEPAGAWDQPLQDVIQEVMQKHMQGVCFREPSAGPHLDPNMRDEGFNVQIGVHETTGFIFGGNRSNCGTWMDKMGDSERAHNKGVPATPRDGSAVEIVGLSKSAVRWLKKLHKDGHFPYSSVTVKRGEQTFHVSYEEWDRRIQEHFEKNFYISHNPRDPSEKQPALVHKRGIYKDSLGASSPWCDYQLRPNFMIAMVVAPELFTQDKAWGALGVAEEKLLGRLGMKTLDPDDLVYCGVYNSTQDSENFNQAKGFNYHQGTEWLWPLGFFLRAKLNFAKPLGKETYDRTVSQVKNLLSHHSVHLQRSPWKGLPQLTNDGGQHCPFSCESHAASMATVLEVLYDL